MENKSENEVETSLRVKSFLFIFFNKKKKKQEEEGGKKRKGCKKEKEKLWKWKNSASALYKEKHIFPAVNFYVKLSPTTRMLIIFSSFIETEMKIGGKKKKERKRWRYKKKKRNDRDLQIISAFPFLIVFFFIIQGSEGTLPWTLNWRTFPKPLDLKGNQSAINKERTSRQIENSSHELRICKASIIGKVVSKVVKNDCRSMVKLNIRIRLENITTIN